MTNPFWNKTLTIYTRAYDANTKTTKWYKYTVNNCFYGVNQNSDLKDLNIIKANTYIARIPFHSSYLPYDQWLVSSDKVNHLSITKGSIIVNGVITYVISDNNSGNTLLNKYADKCFKASIYKENDTFLLKHYYAGSD